MAAPTPSSARCAQPCDCPTTSGWCSATARTRSCSSSPPPWRSPARWCSRPTRRSSCTGRTRAMRGCATSGCHCVPTSTLDGDAMLAAIERERPALVWLASPNNPTGTLFDPADVERIVRATPGLAVVDEAYYAFASSAFLPRVLGVSQSRRRAHACRRSAWPGCGWATRSAHPAWIAEIDKLRSPYNVNALTQAGALALLAEGELFARQTAEVRAERGRLSIALAALPGVRVFASEANFVARARPRRAMRRSAHCAPQASWSRISRLPSAARQLPAHHRRNAPRKRRAHRGARKKRMNAPAE